jgi:hypothetical protein
MKVGTKSILFGVHQFIWHPITVLIAWWKLYGRPNWPEFVCIIIHDWGYWGKSNMDGEEGESHPELACLLTSKWFGIRSEYGRLCLLHSRHYARLSNQEPSKLCWADKLSIKYDPWWFYLPRAILSGEIKEYRKSAADSGHTPIDRTHREWFKWVKEYLSKQGIDQKSSAKLINRERKAG